MDRNTPRILLAGSVTDKEGHAISGAQVSLSWIAQSDEIYEGMYQRETTSDAAGRYRFEGLRAGGHQLWADALGYARGEKIDIQPGPDDVDFVLVRGARIEGKIVRKRDGAPAERVVIACRSATDQDWTPRGQASVVPDGTFAIVGVPAGRYRIDARAHGLAEGRSDELDLAEGETRAGVVIALTEGGTLRGVVLSARTRAPIAGASVARLAAAGAVDSDADRMLDNPDGPTTTDQAGRFELGCLPPGRVRVRVAHDEFSAAMRTIDVEEGKTIEQEFLLGECARVFGRVTGPGGASRAGVEVSAVGPPPGDSRSGTTDAAGRYEIRGLWPGAWLVMLETPDGGAQCGSRTDMRDVQVKEGDAVQVDFAAAETVHAFGTVRRGGKVLPGVQLDWVGASGGGTMVGAHTDDAGAYEMPAILAGAYWVTVAEVRLRVTVPAGREARVDIDVPLGGIAGRVLDRASGAGLAEACVSVYYAGRPGESPTEQQRYAGTAKADAAGAYAMEGLAPGEYGMRASCEGHAPETLASVTVPKEGRAERVDLRLGAAGAIGGVVLDANRRPLAGAWFTLRDRATGVPLDDFELTQIRSGEDGRFAIAGLGAGAYLLGVHVDGHASAQRAVELTAGGKAEVEVPLSDRAGTLRVAARDAAGKPLADATLTLFDSAGRPVEATAGRDAILFRSLSRTGAAGWTERVGLVPGRYRGEVTLGDRRGAFEADVVADQVVEVDVTLK